MGDVCAFIMFVIHNIHTNLMSIAKWELIFSELTAKNKVFRIPLLSSLGPATSLKDF